MVSKLVTYVAKKRIYSTSILMSNLFLDKYENNAPDETKALYEYLKYYEIINGRSGNIEAIIEIR
jgi:hypothetical protein